MEENKGTKKRKRKKSRKLLIILILILIAGLAGFLFWKREQDKKTSASAKAVRTEKVTRMNISSELTASSSLSPKDTYEVTSLVEGEILEALFEEGDVVEKDQVLYRIDASSMDSDLSSAETSLLRAKESLQTAREEYDEAVSLLSGNTYKATSTGYIKTLGIKEGDKVGNGTKLADIYDDSVMKLTVPFLSAAAAQITVGSPAVLTLEDTGEQLEGTVTVVSSLEETLSGGRLVKAVTIEVSNPGGLTTLTQATAAVGEFICSEEGTFTPKTEVTMSADLSGQNSLEVGELLVTEGAYVEAGTPIFAATAQSAEKYLKNFKDSLESAEDNVENAENKLSNTQDNIEDYTITAPISGTVITKNSKVGDKITKGTSGTSTMAVIYDLSAMTLSMSVDELDVGSVKVGQTVEITADAVEGETFTGTVTNVSLESSYSNGVTNYPVTVTLDETGDLLPGMNVDARIILDSSENALCIPVGALMRGNRVYVKETAGANAGAEPEEGAEVGEGGADTRENADAGESSRTGESAEAGEGGRAGEGSEAGASADGTERIADSAEGEENARQAAGQGENSASQGNRTGSQGERAASQSGVPEGFVAVQVETGIINDDYVEILSGLSEGDEVYVSESSGTTTTTWQMGGPGGAMGGPGGQAPGGNQGNRGGNRSQGRP